MCSFACIRRFFRALFQQPESGFLGPDSGWGRHNYSVFYPSSSSAFLNKCGAPPPFCLDNLVLCFSCLRLFQHVLYGINFVVLLLFKYLHFSNSWVVFQHPLLSIPELFPTSLSSPIFSCFSASPFLISNYSSASSPLQSSAGFGISSSPIFCW